MAVEVGDPLIELSEIDKDSQSKCDLCHPMGLEYRYCRAIPLKFEGVQEDAWQRSWGDLQ